MARPAVKKNKAESAAIHEGKLIGEFRARRHIRRTTKLTDRLEDLLFDKLEKMNTHDIVHVAGFASSVYLVYTTLSNAKFIVSSAGTPAGAVNATLNAWIIQGPVGAFFNEFASLFNIPNAKPPTEGPLPAPPTDPLKQQQNNGLDINLLALSVVIAEIISYHPEVLAAMANGIIGLASSIVGTASKVAVATA